MIHVGKISFHFKMADEQFAKGLYANWNEFCQSCFTKILEECLGKYDNKDSYIEVDTLNLNIGSIEQKDFYSEFPKRLRTELERIILSISLNDNPSSVQRKRLDNLIHYLKYGFCLPEWSMHDFDLFEDLMFFKNEESVFGLCFSASYCFERLTRQLDKWQLNILLTHWFVGKDSEHNQNIVVWTIQNFDCMRFLQGYVTDNPLLARHIPRQFVDENEKTGWNLILSWLKSTAFGYYEKQRCLAVVLDTSPQLVLRFIRETTEDNIKDLALLLDSESVHSIIVAETESHADVDIPEYWHHLYLWLIEYYPFNGVAMFGDKQHFIIHLHERFLFFIRKRSVYAYLSKGELTMRFLLEVFGTDYCYDVLNLLYHNQALNEDGSPINSDYFSREIYEILLKLSLLKSEENYNKDIIDNYNELDKNDVFVDVGDFLKKIKPFETWLMDNMISIVQKREFLTLLIMTQPQQVLCWLKEVKNINVLEFLLQVVSTENVFTLVSVVSYNEYSLLSSIYSSLNEVAKEIPWMCKIGIVDLKNIYKNLVVHWLVSDNSIRGMELVTEIVCNIYTVIYKGVSFDGWNKTRKDKDTSYAISEVLTVLARKNIIDVAYTEYIPAFFTYDTSNDVKVIVANIHAIMENSSLSILAKRNLLLLCLDAYTGKAEVIFRTLNEKGILTQVIELLDTTVLRTIIVEMAEEVIKIGSSSSFVLFVGWLVLHVSDVASICSISKTVLIQRIIEQLIKSEWHIETVEELVPFTRDKLIPNSQNKDITFSLAFIANIACVENVHNVMEKIIRLYNATNMYSLLSLGNNNTIAVLFARMQEYLREQNICIGTSYNAARIAFEKSLNDKYLLTEWLQSSDYNVSMKRQVLAWLAENAPQTFMSLWQMSLTENTFSIWNDIVDFQMLKEVFVSVDIKIAKAFVHIGNVIYQWVNNNALLAGSLSAENLLTLLMLQYVDECLLVGKFLTNFKDIAGFVISCLEKNIIMQSGLAGIEERVLKDLEKHLVDTKSYEKQVTLRANADCLNENIVLSRNVSYEEKANIELGNTNHFATKCLILCNGDFEMLAKWLSSSEVSDTEKRHLLRHYTHWQQFVFWDFVEYMYASDTFEVQKLSEWIDIEDWLILIARISYSWAECLKQLTEKSQISDMVSEKLISHAFVLFVARHGKDDWYNYKIMNIAKDYIVGLKDVAERNGLKEESVVLEQVVTNILSELKISDIEEVDLESMPKPNYLPIGNAGLCLFAPWLLRLFGMLDLLNEKKNEFKNIDAKVRAIFILQRLVTAEVRLYKETELAFNRLLVACPFNVPLPKNIELSQKEVETIESMLSGVKANWIKLKNTSVGGFQRSFIERDGFLEQQDKKWVLTVDNKAYDILLDSLPWSYKTIRLPWLKKPIYVKWRNKEEFDNE